MHISWEITNPEREELKHVCASSQGREHSEQTRSPPPPAGIRCPVPGKHVKIYICVFPKI